MSVEAQFSCDPSQQGQGKGNRPDSSRLDSWKAIAEYLRRDVRSVQRWERSLGLPIHRISGEKGGAVFAFTAELDVWLKSRAGNGPSDPRAVSGEGAEEKQTVPPQPSIQISKEHPARPAGAGIPSWIRLSGIIFVLAAGAYLATHMSSHRNTGNHQASANNRIMLAVLPFTNLSGDPGQEYFADGLTEEMITDLGCQNPRALGVIARTSAMKYKNTNKDIAQIGRELGVSYILEGSVRRVGNEGRISAQLIQVSDQTHLWAQNYDLHSQDALSVQRDVAAAIASKIKINLQGSGAGARAQLANPEAYDDYLHGRYLLSQRTIQGFREAARSFNQAITKDPSFALAYAGLADSEVLLSCGNGDPSAPAKAAAQKALALDDTMAEAHNSLAAVDILEWNFPEAEKEFQRAIALNPSYAPAHHWYGNLYLSPMGRDEEAIEQLKQALELDPLSLIVKTDLGYAYFFAGKYDDAFAQYQQVIKDDPSFISAHWALYQYYEQKDMYDQWAQELAEDCRLNGDAPIGERIQALYAVGGRKAVLELLVGSQRNHLHIDGLLAGSAMLSLGDKEEALRVLQKAYNEHAFNLIRMKADPQWKDLRSDPRFQALEHGVGLQ